MLFKYIITKILNFSTKILFIYSQKQTTILKKIKGYYLVFEVAVSSQKDYCLFIILLDFHLIISTSYVQLYELFNLAQMIQGLFNQRQKIPILTYKIIQTLIIYIQAKTTIELFVKKYGNTYKGLRILNKPGF